MKTMKSKQNQWVSIATNMNDVIYIGSRSSVSLDQVLHGTQMARV